MLLNIINKNKVRMNIKEKGDFFNRGWNSLKIYLIKKLNIFLIRFLVLNHDIGRKIIQKKITIQFKEKKKGVAGSKIENRLVIIFKFLKF